MNNVISGEIFSPNQTHLKRLGDIIRLKMKNAWPQLLNKSNIKSAAKILLRNYENV